MSRFRIQSHGRLQEWAAEEKNYFTREGLEYEFLVKPIVTWSADAERVDSSPADIQRGAFESIEDGRGCSLSAACHWTVNMAASAGHGKMWGEAYSVSPSGIFVPPNSALQRPDDLADVPITVGYHSGSHYSTLQGLERFLRRDQIKLHFGGLLLDRLALLVDGQVPAASLFGAPFYVAEQLGFKKLLDTTFMIGHLVSENVSRDDVDRYFKALRRAQHDIDLEPEAYKHYFLRELPERYHRKSMFVALAQASASFSSPIRKRSSSARADGLNRGISSRRSKRAAQVTRSQLFNTGCQCFRNIVARKFSAIVILNEVKNLAQIVASRDEILRRSTQDDITRQRGNAAAIRRRAALPNLRLLDSFPRALARKTRVIGL